MNEDRRDDFRSDCLAPIEYTVSLHELVGTVRHARQGSIINVCEGGLSMRTDMLLEPGHVLIIRNQNHRPAIVRWSRPVDNGYHVGIEFV
jgi:hypothetical protein